jgi:signal transduction histidine kinase/ActR/RegA family two-component response regulator/uncharacterized protein YigA (DUF484 family)
MGISIMQSDLITTLNALLKQPDGAEKLLAYFENFSKRLLQCKDFKSALNTFAAELHNTYPYQHIEIILTQNPQRAARFQYDIQVKKVLPTGEFVQKDTLHQLLISKRQPLLTNDYRSFCHDLGVKTLGINAKGWLGVPLLINNKPLGAVIIWDNREGHFFRLQDKQFLSALAGMMSFAAENIYLQDYITEKNDAFRIFDGLLPKGNARNSLKSILNHLHDAVLIQKDVAYVGLFIGNKRNHQWRLLTEKFNDAAYQNAGISLQKSLLNLPEDIFNEPPPLFLPAGHVAHFLYEQLGRQLDSMPGKSLLLFPFVLEKTFLGAWLIILNRKSEPPKETQQMYRFIFFLITQLLEKKALTDQIRKYQNYTKHLERMKVIGELASGTMHNLNNILSVIIGKASLLQKKLEGTVYQRDLDLILQSANDGASSIRRLQNYASAKDGEGQGEILNINTLIQEVVEIARPRFEEQAQSEGIQYSVKLDLGEVKPIRGDATTLREVLLNLLNNALDAMPNGGELTFRTMVKGQRVIIFVRDTGMGIPEGIQDKIFEPFFTTKGKKGNGLGLSIAAEIIQNHGGSIHVESAPGQGCIFMIDLPASEDRILPKMDQPEFFQPLNYKILLVEDKSIVRETLAEMLEDEGCEVITAENASEAILKFQKYKCDIVFADLSMPKINGLQLAQRLKSLNPEIPVFIVTGWNQIDTDFLQSNLAISGIIQKPFNIDTIRQELLSKVGTLNGHFHTNGFSQ